MPTERVFMFSIILATYSLTTASNVTGQVIFYSKAKPDTLFNVEAVLNGEQFGSSFGYTLLSVDLNGDK